MYLPLAYSPHVLTLGAIFRFALSVNDKEGVDESVLGDLMKIKSRILQSLPQEEDDEEDSDIDFGKAHEEEGEDNEKEESTEEEKEEVDAFVAHTEEELVQLIGNDGLTKIKKERSLLRPQMKKLWFKKTKLASKPKEAKRPKRVEHSLVRSQSNPILSPNRYNGWEAEGTFNPAVFSDDTGKIHLLYRAVGSDGVSRIGYAASQDGVHFDDRLLYPVYEPRPVIDYQESRLRPGKKVYSHQLYPSGGSWGGYEDPRAVVIENRVYLTYVAFGGWGSIRMALTSIDLEDFKNRRWNWKMPVCISPPNEMNKNWLLFPEKIHGKFAVLHSISPEVLIDYVDNFDSFHGPNATFIQSKKPSGGRNEYWDNMVRGAAAPPIKTEYGWLILYHAMDKLDPNKYKLGAMILDLDDPTKILYRSPEPILNPDMHYENDGKPGVVYGSGAIVREGNLYVYYGGGDKHVCVARTNLDSFLKWLTEHGKVLTS